MNPPQDPTAGQLPGVMDDSVLHHQNNAGGFQQQDNNGMPGRNQPSYINNVARVRVPARKPDGAVSRFAVALIVCKSAQLSVVFAMLVNLLMF